MLRAAGFQSFLKHSAAGIHEMKKILKDSRWCDKNALNESFKMSPCLICLDRNLNFLIKCGPDPDAGHKRDLGCQLTRIKWGLILKLSMSLFTWHSPKSFRIFFYFKSLSCPVKGSQSSLAVLVMNLTKMFP